MKVVLVGHGKAGIELHKELTANSHIQSIEVYDPNPRSYNDFSANNFPKTQFSSSPFLFQNSADLLVIASPDHTHTEYISESIQRNIPSFVEKPYVSSCKDLDKIKNLTRLNPAYQSTSNLILRSAPLFQKTKELLASGRFGSKVFIEGKYLYGRWEKLVNGWRGHKDYSVILGGLIHIIDIACYVTSNFKHDVDIKHSRITSKEPRDVLDFSQVTLNSSTTGFFSLTTNFSTNIEHRRDFAIYGDNAWIEIRGNEVRFDVDKLPELQNLTPIPLKKGALLNEFISHLSGQCVGEHFYPTLSEIIQLTDLCLGNSTL